MATQRHNVVVAAVLVVVAVVTAVIMVASEFVGVARPVSVRELQREVSSLTAARGIAPLFSSLLPFSFCLEPEGFSVPASDPGQ